MAVVKRTEITAQGKRERRAWIRRQVEADGRIVVVPDRQRDAVCNLERRLQPFMVEVELGSEAAAVRELDFGEIDVPLSALVEAVEPVVAAKARVRIPLLEPRQFRDA